MCQQLFLQERINESLLVGDGRVNRRAESRWRELLEPWPWPPPSVGSAVRLRLIVHPQMPRESRVCGAGQRGGSL